MSVPVQATPSPAANQATFLGHPVALYVLFFTELWERFSFYGMRALLVLFMTSQVASGGFAWPDAKAAVVYGSYGALVYATPLIGGAFADRVLGYRNAVILGGLVMALGHFTLGLEPFFANRELVFYTALAMLIIGNGFFKPNISSLVGKLYEEGDPRRDGAFTIFYMGINAGAFMAPLVCGFLGERYGWHYGFGAAGVGMAIGLVVFLSSQHLLGEHGLPPGQTVATRTPFTRGITLTWLGSFLAIPLVVGVIRLNELLGPSLSPFVGTDDILGIALVVVGVVVLGMLLASAFGAEPVQRDRLLVVIVLLFFSMTFWAFFEQAGSSINLFTDRNVNRTIFGWEMPTSWGQAINPMFIILFAPLFSGLWSGLARRDADPTPGVKFGLALLQLGAGFVVLWASQFFADEAGMVPLLFLLLGYMLHTTGELCLSPVGLSMVTKLSPAQAVGFVMGAWFLATSYSHYIGGAIAALTGIESEGGAGVTVGPESLSTYVGVFGGIGGVAVAAGVVCLALSPILRKWMHGVK